MQTALAVVSENVKSQGGCVKFEPTQNMIRIIQRPRATVNAEIEQEIVYVNNDQEEDIV